MGWIIAFAFVAATIYTLLNVPDYMLKMWHSNKAVVRSAMDRLKLARRTFGQLEDVVNEYPQGDLIDEIAEVIEQVRAVANPAITNIQSMRNSAIWDLAVMPDESWSLGSAEFWRYGRPIWQMRQHALQIDHQVAETERYVNILDALCVRLDDETIAILPETPPEPEIEVEDEWSYADPDDEEDAPLPDDEIQEIATAFKFSLRQESVESLLGQIDGERAKGMQIGELHQRGLQLQQQLADLEEAAWQDDRPNQTTLDRWLTTLDRWRADVEAVANEVEHIQRRRVEHERNVRRVETKLDEFVVREAESDLSQLAYDLLQLSDDRLEALDWESSADAIQIATAITNGLPNMRAIDQNGRALKQRIPHTSGATRAKLTQAVKRYGEWRALLTHTVTDRPDMRVWLSRVLRDVSQAFAEKSEIIRLLNDAVLAEKAVRTDDETAAVVADVWAQWDEIDQFVTLDDHWLSKAMRDMPSDAGEIAPDAVVRREIRNQAQKVIQTLRGGSAEIQAWEAMIQQDQVGFERTRRETLESAGRWLCLQQAVARVEELMQTYVGTYHRPKLGWLIDKLDDLHAARQSAIERIRQECGNLQTLHDTLQSEVDRIQARLSDVGEESESYRVITAQLAKAYQERDVADARMALQSAKYALED